MSFVGSFYTADIGGAVPVGGELFELGLELDFLSASINGVYAPNRTLLGGRPAISVTVPVGHVDLEAGVNIVAFPGHGRWMAPGLATS